MEYKEKQLIEEAILEITNGLLKEWEEIFKENSVQTDVPIINRDGNTSNYFSEIEFNFWHKGNLIMPCSIIIFMENKQVIRIDEAKAYIQGEIKICYDECVIK